jgi:hypothetical protein
MSEARETFFTDRLTNLVASVINLTYDNSRN